MSKDTKLGWKTDRKDLIGAVSKMSNKDIQKLLRKYMSKDARCVGLRGMRHEQQADRLMLGLIEGLIPESAVLLCTP
jgi:hypothetical protein